MNALGIETQGDLTANLAAIKENGFAFFFAPKVMAGQAHVKKATAVRGGWRQVGKEEILFEGAVK